MKRPSVLVIENNYLDIFIIRALIGKYIDVYVVKNFEEAIKINAKFNFSIVLVDTGTYNHQADNLNLRILKASGKNQDLKVCSITGCRGNIEEFKKRFDHSFSKPVTKDEIFDFLDWELPQLSLSKTIQPRTRQLAAIF